MTRKSSYILSAVLAASACVMASAVYAGPRHVHHAPVASTPCQIQAQPGQKHAYRELVRDIVHVVLAAQSHHKPAQSVAHKAPHHPLADRRAPNHRPEHRPHDRPRRHG